MGCCVQLAQMYIVALSDSPPMPEGGLLCPVMNDPTAGDSGIRKVYRSALTPP